ncbi:MAG: hypothetical protein LBO74_00340, partial [Candidatus Symbiothrix sp.]|nr:hypothetical protein [Candidatus Symbiothrix sp.]
GSNLYDFVARGYDPAVGRFMTIDPLAEKYYSVSPYAYCGNNPINAVDFNGDSITIVHNIGFWGLGGKETLTYENGNLFNSDGSAYTGKVKSYLKSAVGALGSLNTTTEGAALVSELQNSTNMFTIKNGNSEFKSNSSVKAYANQLQTDPSQAATLQTLQNAGVNIAGGSGGTIFWNASGSILPTLNGGMANATTDLAHEMFHALDANRGLLDDRIDQGIKRNEWQAVYRENVLRSQLNIPLRTHYIKAIDSNGRFIGGSGARMLTPTNRPLLPIWYTP